MIIFTDFKKINIKENAMIIKSIKFKSTRTWGYS